MKSLFALSSILFSLSVYSNVELYFKLNDMECYIKGNKVQKKISLMKGELTSVVTYDFASTGLEEMANKAAASSSGLSRSSF